MSRVSEMLLGLQPRMPMCSICKERPHVLKSFLKEEENALYYCLECFPERHREMLKIYMGA